MSLATVSKIGSTSANTGLGSQHPQYTAMIERWELLRHSYDGERAIKAEGSRYLPPTTGMLLDGAAVKPDSKGGKDYQAYLQRAVFHNFVEGAVKISLGKLHRKPAAVKLPTALEPLRERATVNGDPLDVLHMKINMEQLITGRMGLMLDLPSTAGVTNIPYIATYVAERIVNWDDGKNTDPVLQTLNLVVLNETEVERNSSEGTGQFSWDEVEKYRVLALGDVGENEGQATAVYRAGVFSGTGAQFDDTLMLEPSIRGTTLDQIPFVFVNAMDTLTTPDKPPLETLADLGVTAYRTEADYRQSLFMQGQDTLVIIGATSDDEGGIRTGAGAQINILNEQGDAKYIGVDSEGLPELRTAVENDTTRAENLAGQFVDKKQGVESGDAMRRRMISQSATLTDIAVSGANALERILKIAAKWMGANPEEVEVLPNLDFSEDELDGKSASDWMAAKNQGLPLSLQSIWQELKERDVTNFDTFEKEIAQIESEADLSLGMTGPAGTGEPDDLDDDDEELDDEDSPTGGNE